MTTNINEVLMNKCMSNYKYYQSKYGRKFSNMLNYSLQDKNFMIGGLTRYANREDRWLFTTIFELCNSDYRGIPEMVILQYEEYFPQSTIALVKERLNEWNVPYEQYLKELGL